MIEISVADLETGDFWHDDSLGGPLQRWCVPVLLFGPAPAFAPRMVAVWVAAHDRFEAIRQSKFAITPAAYLNGVI